MREYIHLDSQTAEFSDVERDDAENNGWADIETIWDDVVTITGDEEMARQVWEYLVGPVPACGNVRTSDKEK